MMDSPRATLFATTAFLLTALALAVISVTIATLPAP